MYVITVEQLGWRTVVDEELVGPIRCLLGWVARPLLAGCGIQSFSLLHPNSVP